jgi:hypothetical protein
MSSPKTVGSPVQVFPHKGDPTFLSDPAFTSVEFGDQGQGDPAYGDRGVYPGIVHAVRTDDTLDVVVFDQNGHGRMFRGLKYLAGDAKDEYKGLYCRDITHATTGFDNNRSDDESSFDSNTQREQQDRGRAAAEQRGANLTAGPAAPIPSGASTDRTVGSKAI